MFVVFLKFAENRAAAAQHMADHKAWLQRGFDEGAFLLSGSLNPDSDTGSGGGCILAIGASIDAIRDRVAEDPFVAEAVVRPEIVEMTPSKAVDALGFLTAQNA